MSTLLEEKMLALHKIGIAPAVLAHLEDHIRHAPSVGLVRMSSYRLAERWQVAHRDVLSALLYGTRLGLFDLHWELRCPSCKGASKTEHQLSALRPTTHCQYCRINYEAGFDDAVEVLFRINQNIRPLQPITFPEYLNYWRTWELISRFTLPVGDITHLDLALQPGTYHFCVERFLTTFDLALSFPIVAEARPALAAQTLTAVYDGHEFHTTGEHYVAAGTLALDVTNQTAAPLECALIYAAPRPWLSAAALAANQEFRDMFSTELISADESFAISSQAFVFTDIKGSTELYERLGDAQAYQLVREHFKILIETVKAHNGAVVKTIGDAIMATFCVSADAAQALFAMQQAFATFNAREKTHDEVIIKVGAHQGACIAVTSNDRLDYFGQAINIAARVQGLSTGNDLMLTRSFYEEPAVHAVVAQSGWQVDHIKAPLKGLTDLYDVVHVQPSR